MLKPRDARAKVLGIASERLRIARERRNLSQAEAAQILCSERGPRWLAKLEDRRIEVPMWLISRACRAYGVSADYLLGTAECPDANARTLPAPIVEAVCRGLIRDAGRRHAEASTLIDTARHLLKLRRLAGVVATLAGELAGAQAEVEREDAWQDVRGGSRWAVASERLVELLGKLGELSVTPGRQAVTPCHELSRMVMHRSP